MTAESETTPAADSLEPERKEKKVSHCGRSPSTFVLLLTCACLATAPRWAWKNASVESISGFMVGTKFVARRRREDSSFSSHFLSSSGRNSEQREREG